MKRLILMLAIFSASLTSSAQDDPQTWFDFWVGKWNVTWSEPGGKSGKGINNVVKILDNTVIEENFQILEGASKGYLGKSLSVFNPKRNTWHQGYADNQGAYFNLQGIRDGEKRIFQTESTAPDGRKQIQRMVFYDISADAFTWDWESSQDDGKSWTLNWRIHYARATK